ncbi:hypothetical protein [Citreimonas salinaria]|nr:hypothetical protein [Citreimonas salinaria]
MIPALVIGLRNEDIDYVPVGKRPRPEDLRRDREERAAPPGE